MQYTLSTSRKYHPLQGAGIAHHRGVKYDAEHGFITQGFTELNISIKRGGKPSFNELIAILNHLPSYVTGLKFGRGILTGFSIEQIKKLFSALPAGISHLDLYGLFQDAPLETLQTALQYTPTTVLNIDLGGNQFDRFGASELAMTLQLLHAGLTHLSLIGNNLGHFALKDLVKILDGLAASLEYLALLRNGLEKFDVDEYIAILQAPFDRFVHTAHPIHININLPDRYCLTDRIKILQAIPGLEIRDINELCRPELCTENPDEATHEITQLLQHLSPLNHRMHISANYANKFSPANLIKILRCAPKSIKQLHLSLDNRFTSSERIAILSAIGPWIELLNVHIDYKNVTADEMVNEFNAIPEPIKMLSINSANPLFRHHRTQDSVKVVRALPPSHKKLRLYWLHDQLVSAEYPTQGWNYYLNDDKRPPAITANDIISLVANMPDTILMLDLHEIGLYRLGTDDLVRLMQSIHKGVVYLDFSTNGLFKLGVEGVMELMKQTPGGVKFLDLRGNLFSNELGPFGVIGADFSPEDLQRILLSVPKHVTHVYLDEKDVQRMQVLKGDFYYDSFEECCIRATLLQNHNAKEYASPLYFSAALKTGPQKKIGDAEDAKEQALTLHEKRKKAKL